MLRPIRLVVHLVYMYKYPMRSLCLPVFCIVLPLLSSNMVWSSPVQKRIDRVTNGLLPDTTLFERIRDSVWPGAVPDNQFGAPDSLKNRMAHYHTPGVSIAVINNYKIEWAQGFGVKDSRTNEPVTTSTLFQAASISKPIFALAVMRLVQDGKLDLDADINSYLTSWTVPPDGAWQPRITLRQILSHTAGLTVHGFSGYRRGQKLPTVLEILKGQPPANSEPVLVDILPGTQLRYSGGGTVVAQQLVVDVLGKPFPTIMNDLVLNRLELKNSTFEQPLPKTRKSAAATGYQFNGTQIPGKWHVYPEMAAAGLWTTPSDLAKIGVELQLTLRGESEKILSQQSISQMLTPGIDEHLGIGFFLKGKDGNINFFHGGSNEGFKAVATFYKNSGQGAVIMVNSDEGGPMVKEIERAIALEYEWPGYFEEKKEVALAPKTLKLLAGTYRAKSGAIYEIVEKKDKLFLILKNQSPVELRAESETDFSAVGLNTKIIFDKIGLTIQQDGNSISAQQVRDCDTKPDCSKN